MTRVSYDQLKSLVASHWHGVPLQSLQHRVQLIAERHLPSHNDLLPLRAIHDCDQPDQILTLLEKWALLSPTKIKILQHLCDGLQGNQSMSLLDALDSYTQCTSRLETCPCSSLPSLSQQDSQFSDRRTLRNHSNGLNRPEIPVHYAKIVDFLSDELGRRWLDVGRRLPGLRNFVRNLSEDHTLDAKNKIVLMLEEHYSNNGHSAVSQLLEALAACRLNRHKDRIQDLLPPDFSDVSLCPPDPHGTYSYA